VSLIVKKVEIIPLEVVVRNVVTGSLQKRTGLPEGQTLKNAVVELYYKDDALGDPLINDEHVQLLNIATEAEVSQLKKMGREVNTLLSEIFAAGGLRLIDFKLEFGRLDTDRGTIVLADEISPDTCRLWDAQTGEKLDKDRFRQDLGSVMEAYAEVLRRLEKTDR
jgi:phosphoribosylaminoimidazole-succinocarboxamide synthase